MARTPVRRLIERGIEAGADYIPDVIETPLRKAFSIDVPKSKASKPKASLAQIAVTPKAKSKPPSLLSAVRVGGKTYTGPTHLDALDAIPDPKVRSQASLDANSRGFVNERGKYMDRFKAADYARNFDLFSPDAPDWAKTAPEVISENLRLPELAVKAETPSTARLKRAQEQGFNTELPLYHGTSSDFPEFSAGREIFLTDKPDIANIYAVERGKDKSRKYGPSINSDPNVRPVFAKMQKPLIVSDVGPDGSHGWLTDNMAAALGIDNTSGPKLRGRALYNEARRQGYDTVQIENMLDLGGEQTQYVPLSPDYIKSQFDLFEPTAPIEQSGPKTAGWSPSRIDNLLSSYADFYEPDRTKALATRINPRDFLGLTLPKEYIETFDTQVRPLDMQRLGAETQPLFLRVSPLETGELRVTGHEGRHRMAALRDAGVESVPIVVGFDRSATRGPLEAATLLPEQYIGWQPSGGPVGIRDALPISDNGLEALLKAMRGDEGFEFKTGGRAAKPRKYAVKKSRK